MLRGRGRDREGGASRQGDLHSTLSGVRVRGREGGRDGEKERRGCREPAGTEKPKDEVARKKRRRNKEKRRKDGADPRPRSISDSIHPAIPLLHIHSHPFLFPDPLSPSPCCSAAFPSISHH